MTVQVVLTGQVYAIGRTYRGGLGFSRNGINQSTTEQVSESIDLKTALSFQPPIARCQTILSKDYSRMVEEVKDG